MQNQQDEKSEFSNTQHQELIQVESQLQLLTVCKKLSDSALENKQLKKMNEKLLGENKMLRQMFKSLQQDFDALATEAMEIKNISERYKKLNTAIVSSQASFFSDMNKSKAQDQQLAVNPVKLERGG